MLPAPSGILPDDPPITRSGYSLPFMLLLRVRGRMPRTASNMLALPSQALSDLLTKPQSAENKKQDRHHDEDG